MKILFVDNSELTYTGYTDISNVIATYDTIDEIGEEFTKFTPENVETLRLLDDEGIEASRFENMLFDGVTIENVATEEGVRFKAHFAFRQENEIERLNKLVLALQASQEVQDGAIDDLGEAVSTLYDEE